MKLQRLTNGTFEDEMALINIEDNEVLIKGDSYHNKIYEQIEGFLLGLSYCNCKYKLVKNKTVNPKDKLFDICEFSNEDYSSYEDNDEVLPSYCEVDEEFDLLEDINEDEELDKFIEGVKIEITPHLIKHKFEISSSDGDKTFFGNIIDALDETKDCEGDLFLTDNEKYSIIYSCQGLELEDNNSVLKEFGVYYNEENQLCIIREN